MKTKIEKAAPYLFIKRVINAFKRDGIRVITRRLKGVFGLSTLGYSALFAHKLDYVDVDSEYQENIDFSAEHTDVKMLAYYLPQFHTFKENDEWWGKGFTEWTNTRAANPRFHGHYQPRTPHEDIGYYDLSDINTLKQQVELAKQHKIYGFCFYYYWFSGKRLMEKPVDMLLCHPEIDFPFCLCWANENWTRTWDGKNRDVLIAQNYSDGDDERFILDMKKYIDDKRYIRINGRPLVVVYNPGQIPNCKKTFSKWREVAKKSGIGEIYIWTCRMFEETAKKLGIEDYIDAEIEFPPHNTRHIDFAVRNIKTQGRGHIFNYQKVVDGLIYDYQNDRHIKKGTIPVHPACMMAWDNAARRKTDWFTYHNFSLKSLYSWVLAVCDKARRDFNDEERFVFINAWNEWAEGTYLEPDEKYGYANINTVSKALTNSPFDEDLLVINNDAKSLNSLGQRKIAVQIHMFYTETLDETIKNVNKIPFEFDCFVSTDSDQKAELIRQKLANECKCKNATVEIFENRGRDVAPFIFQMADRIDNYDYICHIHSKRTVTGDHGNDWREYIFWHLFGSEEYLKRLFCLMENDRNLGIIFPETFPPLEKQCEWGGNLAGCMALLAKLGVSLTPGQNPVFPVGNMFWAKAEAVRGMFKNVLTLEDFPEENRQVNATVAHCIERIWVYLASDYGFTYKKVFNNVTFDTLSLTDDKRIAFYAHYNKENILSCADLESLKEYKKIFEKIIFVSNSKIDGQGKKELNELCDTVLIRDNSGFDFAAWKYGLEYFGYDNLKQYDSVALINNSTLPPLFCMNDVFNKMQGSADFWGITLFPELREKAYLNTRKISEHLQSYFVVFEKEVINSGAIKEFFDKISVADSFTDAVLGGEVALSRFMSKNGFTYAPYISESYYIWNYLGDYKIPYDKPVTFALLRCPLVKKKAYSYMSGEQKILLEEFIKKIKGTEYPDKFKP